MDFPTETWKLPLLPPAPEFIVQKQIPLFLVVQKRTIFQINLPQKENQSWPENQK